MKKQELITKIAQKTGFSKTMIEKCLSAEQESIIEELQSDWTVAISWFWTFRVSHRAQRNGVNPRTKEKLIIPAMKTPQFKAGKIFKDALKNLSNQ